MSRGVSVSVFWFVISPPNMVRNDNKPQISDGVCGNFDTQLETLYRILLFQERAPKDLAHQADMRHWHLPPRDENNHKSIF